jgi:hypothetical protein
MLKFLTFGCSPVPRYCRINFLDNVQPSMHVDQTGEHERYEQVCNSPTTGGGEFNSFTASPPVQSPTHSVDYAAYGHPIGYFAAASQGQPHSKQDATPGLSKPDFHFTQHSSADVFSDRYASSRSHTLEHAMDFDMETRGGRSTSTTQAGAEAIAVQRPRSFTLGYNTASRPSSIGIGAGLPGSLTVPLPKPSDEHLRPRPHTSPPAPPSASSSSASSASSVPSHAVSGPSGSAQGSHSSAHASPTHRSVKVTLPPTAPGEPGRRVKMHQCSICQKLFPRPSGLSTHMNSHSGARRECSFLDT